MVRKLGLTFLIAMLIVSGFGTVHKSFAQASPRVWQTMKPGDRGPNVDLIYGILAYQYNIQVAPIFDQETGYMVFTQALSDAVKGFQDAVSNQKGMSSFAPGQVDSATWEALLNGVLLTEGGQDKQPNELVRSLQTDFPHLDGKTEELSGNLG